MKIGSKLHLALGFDQNYFVPFNALAASVFANNPDHTIVFHVIAAGLSEWQKHLLEKYIDANAGSIHFYEVADDFAAGFTAHGWYGRATYFRLLFASLLPVEINKFLYIDTDIIVVGNLADLFATAMQGYPLAAVADPVSQPREELGMKTGDVYFNAGVLLIDREEWVKQQISEKTLNFLGLHHKICVYVDQDALNAVLVGNWFPVSSRFNIMPDYIPKTLKKRNYALFLQDKVIIHYTQFYKPWHFLCSNKLRFLYHQYLKLTPVSDKNQLSGFAFTPQVMLAWAKIKARELYYNYPIMPVGLVDNARRLLRSDDVKRASS